MDYLQNPVLPTFLLVLKVCLWYDKCKSEWLKRVPLFKLISFNLVISIEQIVDYYYILIIEKTAIYSY